MTAAAVIHITFRELFELTDAAGKVWRFEWHDYCGVDVVGRRDESLARQPGRRSAFWPAFQKWLDDHRAGNTRGRLA